MLIRRGAVGCRQLLEQWAGPEIGRLRRCCFPASDAVYNDVTPNEWLVYRYEMHLDEKKVSVSMELNPAGAKTTLKVTEQGAFLDGYNDAGSREHGTGLLLDALLSRRFRAKASRQSSLDRQRQSSLGESAHFARGCFDTKCHHQVVVAISSRS